MSWQPPPISDETLFGYLLGSLPADEQAEIEQKVRASAELQQRVEDLRSLLEPIEATDEFFEPRANLAKDTVEMILGAGATSNETEPAAPLSWAESGRGIRIAWLDSFASLAAGVVILSILLPSVWYAREASRRTTCASNLRELGEALAEFSSFDDRRQLPKIAAEGPLSFAGVYAIRLKDNGLLPTTRWLWCPADEFIEPDQSVPSMSVFLAAKPEQQQMWRHTIGGTYSSYLGNIVDGEYETPCLSGRSNFALIGDTLLTDEATENKRMLHCQNASNILYEDGRIQLVKVQSLPQSGDQPDHPYLNIAREKAAGIGPLDSCLGRSYQSPLRRMQR